MPNLVITGANRGIGLALATRYASEGWTIHATAREPEKATALKALPNTTVYPLDVTSQASIDAFAKALDGLPVDHLINNSGIMGPRELPFGSSQMADWVEVLTVNTAAPWLVTERLAANLEAGKGKRVGIVSSQLGSITNASLGWPPLYGTSKTGVNMVGRMLSLILADKGIVLLLLHPGWVRTDMGGSSADISAEESADGIYTRLKDSTPEMNGCFFTYDGTPMPW